MTVREDESRDAQLRALGSLTHTLALQMADLAATQKSVAATLASSESRMKRIEEKLDENTDITEGVRDVLTAGRVATQVIKWLGIIGAAVAGIWAAVLAFKAAPGVGPGP